MAKKNVKEPDTLRMPPPVPLSGGDSDIPDTKRESQKYWARPTPEDKTAPAPMGLEMPAPVEISGGSSNKPLPRKGDKQFMPEDKTAPAPMGLEMPSPVPFSDESIRTKKAGSKPLCWTDRGYTMPTGVEKLDE